MDAVPFWSVAVGGGAGGGCVDGPAVPCLSTRPPLLSTIAVLVMGIEGEAAPVARLSGLSELYLRLWRVTVVVVVVVQNNAWTWRSRNGVHVPWYGFRPDGHLAGRPKISVRTVPMVCSSSTRFGGENEISIIECLRVSRSGSGRDESREGCT